MRERTLPRKPVVLSEFTQRRLGMYALAASAAGVGVLALPPTAEAKIIYTKTRVVLQGDQPFPLDFNHDGIADFYLLFRNVETFGGFAYEGLDACHHPNGAYGCIPSASSSYSPLNAIRVNQTGSANALHAGKVVKKGQRFKDKVPVAMGAVAWVTWTSGRTTWGGPWVNGGKGVKNRYLGLKFQINGRFHFGWARLTVATTPPHDFKATLTGYAYETIPSKPIVTGQTTGPDAMTVQPATLGRLAMGRK